MHLDVVDVRAAWGSESELSLAGGAFIPVCRNLEDINALSGRIVTLDPQIHFYSAIVLRSRPIGYSPGNGVRRRHDGRR